MIPQNHSAREMTSTSDWDFAYEAVLATKERLRHRPFKVVALEIDGVQVWPQPSPIHTTERAEPRGIVPACPEERRMVSAELMGDHSHTTVIGAEVHVWKRGSKYLVRGRMDGRPFGETLGDDVTQATARLRQILTEIDNGSYVRASEARKRRISRARARRLTLRELIAEFVAHKRQARGRQTAGDYASRLAPVLDFAERAANLKRWRLALDINTEFVTSLRAFLFEYRSTRNGRLGGQPRMLSGRQVTNILQCLRTALHWARSAEPRILPADWVVPLTPELVGRLPPKNPLRKDKLPLETRVALVERMDRWQFCHLIFSVVLPLRPDEAAGLLISDVNFDDGWLEFGARFLDRNFTKARTAFNVPFPEELLPILRACIGGRTEGPLLRSRATFDRGRRIKQVATLADLDGLYQSRLLLLPQGAVQSDHDRKLVFRKLLRQLGGISEDSMNKEFKQLLRAAGVKNGSTIYTLRSSVTTALHFADLSLLDIRYLTGHATGDIINTYAGLNPIRAMRRYFDAIRPLLNAIAERAKRLGLV